MQLTAALLPLLELLLDRAIGGACGDAAQVVAALFRAFLLLAGIADRAANFLVQRLLLFVPEARHRLGLERLVGVGARFAFGVGELKQLPDGGWVGIAELLRGGLQLR